jgi:hypothetical protein
MKQGDKQMNAEHLLSKYYDIKLAIYIIKMNDKHEATKAATSSLYVETKDYEARCRYAGEQDALAVLQMNIEDAELALTKYRTYGYQQSY